MISEQEIFRLSTVEQLGLSIFTEFAETIQCLPLRPADVHGDVLIGGQGATFPKRLLVCSFETEFRKLRHGVNSITTSDPEFFTNPEYKVDHPVKIKHAGQTPSLEPEKVNYYPESLYSSLSGIPEGTFDATLFFRIPRLDEQLSKENLLSEIRRVLKPNGVFTGSGGFNSQEEAAKILAPGFKIETITKLANPDYSGYLYRTQVGFILRKQG